MKEKLEALIKFKAFKEKIESEIGCEIKCLHTNNRREHTSEKFIEFFK
jgi:hypothetical protein